VGRGRGIGPEAARRRNTILDLFGESGTTLIACEKSGRQARVVEIDPKYCDVIVRRWEAFTSRQAHHERNQAGHPDDSGRSNEPTRSQPATMA
jgi:hypothetical protein